MNATYLLSPDTRGSTPLWRVFWLYGVLFSSLYFALIVDLFPQIETGTLTLLLVGFAAYSVAIARGVWINASNTGNRLAGEIARYLTVAWSLNALLVSGFLFLSHASGTRQLLP